MPLRIQLPPRPKKAVRILALSDWRVQDYRPLLRFLDTKTEIDLIVYAGDDLNRLLADDTLVPQLASHCAAQRLLFVAGNDDLSEDRDRLRGIKSAHDLEQEPFFFKGIAVCGLEGTTDGMGNLQHTERSVLQRLARHMEEIRKRFAKRRSSSIVLVSHAPPRGVLDHAIRFSASGAARGIGSPALRKFLDENCVPLTICGHVHLCGGQQEQIANQNLVLNIASHDDPKAEGRLALIDLAPGQSPELLLFSTRDLQEEDELLLLHQVSVPRAEELRRRGIVSLAHVTEQNRERLRVSGTGNWNVDRWIRQAALLHSGRAAIEIIEPDKLRFLERPRFVTWDIETDLAQTRIWLIGAFDTCTGEFRQFFDPDDEPRCVSDFLSWMAERADAVPINYSNSKLESRALGTVLRRYGLTDEADVVNRDIDLCQQLENRCIQSFRVPFRLKEFAPALGFRFRHTDLDGMAVGKAFERYLRSREVPNWDKLREYNEDDVRATLHIFERLQSLYRSPSSWTKINRNREADSPRPC